MQHWIWQYRLGYALHPKIPLRRDSPVRIADVAAGNGDWILEVNRSSPSGSVELDGFDITPSHFPAAGWLPKNIRFHVWDAFSEVPEEYVGAFDVVHIRTIYSAIIDDKVEPLLHNLVKMLKPVGYLQWDESDASTLACRVPGLEVKADATHTLVKLQTILSAQSKLSPKWLHDIPHTLHASGCELIEDESFEPKRELAKAWTDNLLLVWRGIIPMIPEADFPLPPGMGLPEKMSRKAYAALFAKAVEETSNGVALGMVYHVFVAKKRQ